MGFEPTTSGLKGPYSTIELPSLILHYATLYYKTVQVQVPVYLVIGERLTQHGHKRHKKDDGRKDEPSIEIATHG